MSLTYNKTPHDYCEQVSVSDCLSSLILKAFKMTARKCLMVFLHVIGYAKIYLHSAVSAISFAVLVYGGTYDYEVHNVRLPWLCFFLTAYKKKPKYHYEYKVQIRNRFSIPTYLPHLRNLLTIKTYRLKVHKVNKKIICICLCIS